MALPMMVMGGYSHSEQTTKINLLSRIWTLSFEEINIQYSNHCLSRRQQMMSRAPALSHDLRPLLISFNIIHPVDSTDLNMDGNINLWCWVQDNKFDPDHLFQVNMKFGDTISKLKQAIMPLERIAVSHMKLWKVGELYWFGANA